MELKRGLLFTSDALVASFILVSAIILISSFYVEETNNTQVSMVATDMMNVFSQLTIDEIENEYIAQLIANEEVLNENSSLIELIGELYSQNKTDQANDLIHNLTQGMIADGFGIGVYFDGEEVYASAQSTGQLLFTSKKMVSGYETGKPAQGSASRAYLKSIREKKTASYSFFGGFVGQGNISQKLDLISEDAQFEESFIELDTGADYELYINDIWCGSFTSEQINMTSTRHNTTACNTHLVAGSENNISIVFDTALNQSL